MQRGTTSGSVQPHDCTLTASNNAICCIGRTRPPLLTDGSVSGRPLREVFRRLSPLPCTNRQLSGGKGALTSSLRHVYRDILAKRINFVKHFP